MTPRELWDRYRRFLCVTETVGFWLDISRMRFPAEFLETMAPRIGAAYDAMEALEGGAIANPDEGRMVGHYWLRAPELAPAPALRREIEATLASIESFAADVHAGRVRPERAMRFRNILVVGIGGSALGPQFVADALGSPSDPMQPFFLDNTDPDGIDRVLARIGAGLDETLTLVISKSGGTKETRNGMIEARAAYAAAGLSFPRHAVAVTGEGSELDLQAREAGFLARFPMWDWVGGRTSETAAVGLLPAALEGIAIRELLAGAKAMDVATRSRDTAGNPAALLALMWHHAGAGRGAKDMVVLPYCDRLLLFSRYLQQLVMESLGKERDLEDRIVHQGIAVYGNKGSTDQHAYVQQLRDGIDNFFAVFIDVVRERSGRPAGGRGGGHLGRFPLRLPAGNPQGPVRERTRVDHPHGPRRGPPDGRRPDRPVRARRRLLRLVGRHQRLQPARRRGGEEGRSGGDRPAAAAPRRASCPARAVPVGGAARGGDRRTGRGRDRLQGAPPPRGQPGARRRDEGGRADRRQPVRRRLIPTGPRTSTRGLPHDQPRSAPGT